MLLTGDAPDVPCPRGIMGDYRHDGTSEDFLGQTVVCRVKSIALYAKDARAELFAEVIKIKGWGCGGSLHAHANYSVGVVIRKVGGESLRHVEGPNYIGDEADQFDEDTEPAPRLTQAGRTIAPTPVPLAPLHGRRKAQYVACYEAPFIASEVRRALLVVTHRDESDESGVWIARRVGRREPRICG
ncbi:hypothetical protein NDU88_002906 [Pleurodeles waltl]|uniref:Uncharacterized protein n=1 Tax=Pleurodeles waltl TaxID=8319 RepID=A0AAV7QE66_PLEWA|nr:hypothetical protein NDU88_002906 [Pleurodeles waltl]